MRIRRSFIWAFATAVVLIQAGLVSAEELADVDGNPIALAQLVSAPKTLVLIAREEAEVRESFRLLTLAEARKLPAVLIVELSGNQPLRSVAIRKAARSFLKSNYSRERIFFAADGALPTLGEARAAILDAELRPIWRSPAFPSSADFDSTDFRP